MQGVDFSSYSDVGGRTNNEDAYLAKKISNGYLFIVADGLGGHDDGEMASNLAVKSIEEFMTNNNCEDIVEAVGFAGNAVLDMQREYSSKMKTTIALAYVTESNTQIAHVGDSRVYAFKDGKLVHQTRDHSASQLAVSVGEIQPEDIRNHEDRNILLRALGAGEEVKVEVTKLQNIEFDTLLLCSDGFWEYVLESEMENELSNSISAGMWLEKMRAILISRAPEKCDNNTAIAVMIDKNEF